MRSPLAAILGGLVDDVERAAREPLEIFPVAHHSPSSAIHMVRRLAQRPPRVIFMECCEDLRPLLDGLRDCKLPVALQAFASTSDGVSPRVVAAQPRLPAHGVLGGIPGDRLRPGGSRTPSSSSWIVRWTMSSSGCRETTRPSRRQSHPATTRTTRTRPCTARRSGVEIGSLVPTHERFCQLLLKNARVSHYSEWWDQFVEEAIIDGDYAVYRQVMFLIGSLFHRLGRTEPDLRRDELRERHMWTRMKQYLRDNRDRPARRPLHLRRGPRRQSRPRVRRRERRALGHSAAERDRVALRTDPQQLRGDLPSVRPSPGAVTLDEARWRKSLARKGCGHSR